MSQGYNVPQDGFAAVDLSETGYDSDSWSTPAFADYGDRKVEGAIPLQGRRGQQRRDEHRGDDEYSDYDDGYIDDLNQPAEEGLLGDFKRTAKRQAKHYMRKPWFLMCGLGLILGLIILSSMASNGPATPTKEGEWNGPSQFPVTLDHVFNRTFGAHHPNYEWISGSDGSYSFRRLHSVVVKHIQSDNETILMDQARDAGGNLLEFSGYFISNNLEYVLVEVDYEKGWRHSFYANYLLWDVKAQKAVPLTTTKSDKYIHDEIGSGKIALALWSPHDAHVAWVRDNDLYVTLNANVEVRITHDGSKELINGIADWVYEEEVLGTHDAMWFSPAGTHIAFLKFNESLVPEYHLQYYERKQPNAYLEQLSVKYPKPGYPNPVVTLHIATPGSADPAGLDLAVEFEKEHYFRDDDRLIVEVAWVSDESLLVRMTNRVQDSQRLYLVASETGPSGTQWKGKMVRNHTETDGGWITRLQPLRVIPPSTAVGRSNPSYVELAENEAGYSHLAYYSSIESPEPKVWLTSGKWEVDKILAVDSEKGRVYFTSTEQGPTQRHVYSVRLNQEKQRLTPPKEGMPNPAYPSWNFPTHNLDKDTIIAGADATQSGYYTANFSPGCAYYILDYVGPDVPWSLVVQTDGEWYKPDQDNKHLREIIPTYAMPRRSFIQIPTAQKAEPAQEADTVPIPKAMMNAMLQVPFDFDRNATKQYPVLMRVYGGPNSQLVEQKFGVDFMSAIVSAGGFITLTVDNRGTGFMGRKFRTSVASHLGSVEVDDQIAAAQWLGAQPFVDPKRIAIWGWSYGGYMATKVVEANSGVIALGMAVAPVTDWKYYDSIYTERFMKSPRTNPEGYEKSAVTNMVGFKNTKFLVIHGTGDDNVHFQNTASLIWRLTGAHIRNYRVQIYTDSDHFIYANDANAEVYSLLWTFVHDAFVRKT
ncbi:hypothetical protein PhCBS80983_g00697 [Powellomyces hirtus]|uniref:Dipeptidyl-peptidase IV n=1 Tax=Powellomyces hirtus TaxID=109895 RepID=A0A507EG63_9FUNG|nr:hypothetical protein PhCBS80983_g00697 [Powellomyces hirtus]